MLGAVLASIHNYFERRRLVGTFTVSRGTMDVPQAASGQYVRIVGSVFNDGVYRIPLFSLIDEVFDGEIWLLAVPADVVSIAEEIEDWCAYNTPTPYQSESFGGYSYTKDGDGSWQSAFASRLRQYRRLNDDSGVAVERV